MEKTTERKNHGKTIIMHLKRHHKKYLFGAFGGFAIVKMALLFLGLGPALNIGNIFADNEKPITLTAENLEGYCDIRTNNDNGEVEIECMGKNIGSIETGAFSGYAIKKLDLRNNKLSVFDFAIFEGTTYVRILSLLSNQIFDMQNSQIINNLGTNELLIEENCLPNDKITSLPNNITNIYANHQAVCLYVYYSPDSWTNGNVEAIITLTGNVETLAQNKDFSKSTSFIDNGSQYFNVNELNEDSGMILNYPENGNFPANVSWIDKTPPECGSWQYDHPSTSNWINTNVTATLNNAIDNDSGIYDGRSNCTIDSENSTCSVEIEDIAGNVTQCVSDRSYNIDNESPSISLDKESGNISNSHSVTVTLTDDKAGFQENASLYYRRQTNNNCSNDISKYDSKALQNNEGEKAITTTVTVADEGEYYLCILGISDRAGNSNNTLRSEGTFVVEDNGHGSSPEPMVTGGLVGFGENTISSFWIADSDTADIIWYLGSIGGWRFSPENISGTDNIPDFNGIQTVNSGGISIYLDNENQNGKYICAFAQTGQYIQTICSDNTIKIDRTDPTITLTQVSNNELGDSVTLSRNGSDGQSGISEYILTITKPNNSTITKHFNHNILSTGITVDQTGTWNWSVKAIDGVGKTAETNSNFVVSNTEPTPPDPQTETGILIQFESQPNSSWSQSTSVTFRLAEGANGEWSFSTTNNTGNFSCDMGCNPITSLTINFSDTVNGQYVCAIAHKGDRNQTICSDHLVRVDNLGPSINLLTPENGTNFEYGNDVIFRWSGYDNGPAGLSGYILTIAGPNETNSYNISSGTHSKQITVNRIGTWNWSVKADDLAGNRAEKTGYFHVYGNDNETGFYLISPKLFEIKSLGRDIRFERNTGVTNSEYKWKVKKIGGNIVSDGTTYNNNFVLDDEYFSEGSYSRSVTEYDSHTTKEIPLFYVITDGYNPDLKVNQFEFYEINNADVDEYYTSNKITIRGLEDDRYSFVHLKDGIGALYINGEFAGTEGIVTNGDKIYIELKASSGYNSTTVSKLIIGTGENLVSGDFKITTKGGITGRDDSSLTSLQRLWGVIYVDSLVEMYQYDEEKLATFLSTFMQILKDKSDYYAQKIEEAESDGDDELMTEYKTYKNAIDFLYVLVKYRYDNIDVQDRTVYIAPNGKQYLVEYDENRRAYTSPDFARPKYFPSRNLFTNHIDTNNPAVGKWGMAGNVITTHNGKVYTIYETNGKWTSSNFKTKKYFDTKEDIINHILANNPASDWNHTIDSNFEQVTHTAPNGKVYKIFKTSSKGNNPEMYSSYNFVNAKYFTTLEAAKKFIDQSNPKK